MYTHDADNNQVGQGNNDLYIINLNVIIFWSSSEYDTEYIHMCKKN